MKTQIIKWGIIGTGRIARAFAEGLQNTSNGQLCAIASRNLNSAIAFAKEWNIQHAFGTYEELAKSDVIDAVYIATPHSSHAENSILCMRNGKAVLCEKPFAVNAKEVEAMITVSKENNILLMEGMWSRFPPLMFKLRDWIKSGKLGIIKALHADFGFLPIERNPKGRLLNLELAGGSLLDLGIYPISLASMILGKPSSMQTLAHIGETGVDEQASWIFKYPGGELAILMSSLQCETRQEAFISGTLGNVRIHKQCWKPQKMTFSETNGDAQETVEMPFTGNGFNYEAESFGNLLLEGAKESSVMPLSESLEIMTQLDQIRQEWGLVYPMD
jgi:predicted dehydrogenase